MATPYQSGSFSPKSFTDSNGSTVWRPEPLSRTSALFKWIILRALPTNTGLVCIGNETISAQSDPIRGAWFFAGERWEDQDIDLSQIFIDVSVANEGVSYTVGRA